MCDDARAEFLPFTDAKAGSGRIWPPGVAERRVAFDRGPACRIRVGFLVTAACSSSANTDQEKRTKSVGLQKMPRCVIVCDSPAITMVFFILINA